MKNPKEDTLKPKDTEVQGGGAPDTRSGLEKLKKRRRSLEDSKPRRQSLEGLRLGGLLRQLEALQALQGLKELQPSEPGKAPRFKPSSDPQERARQRQWLMFKADWLEALLESTLAELEEMNRLDDPEETRRDGPKTP